MLRTDVIIIKTINTQRETIVRFKLLKNRNETRRRTQVITILLTGPSRMRNDQRKSNFAITYRISQWNEHNIIQNNIATYYNE